MKKALPCLIVCVLLIMCFTGCTQKTKTMSPILPSFDEMYPTFELEASTSYMDQNEATMTLYFATDNRNSSGNENYHFVIYVSNLDKFPTYGPKGRETVADYRAIEGYTVLADYERGNSYYADEIPFLPLQYDHSEPIIIPSEHLQGGQGVLYFYLCYVYDAYEVEGYDILTSKGIENICYEIQDGQVKFDFSGYETGKGGS